MNKKIEVHGNILFLQGPMGSFFSKFNRYFRSQGLFTYKIDFNLGDCLFGSFTNRIFYQKEKENWLFFLSQFIKENNIQTLFMFGLNKYFHRVAKEYCEQINIVFYVFEEGYLRPDFITLEQFGVNGESRLSKNPKFYLEYDNNYSFEEQNGYASMHASSFMYFLGLCRFFAFAYIYYGCLIASYVFRIKFFFHKQMNIKTLWSWHKTLFFFLISYFFKGVSKRTKNWATHNQSNYFFVPLQVHNDSQIQLYSQYKTVEEFIKEVMSSFARYANKSHHLLIKIHPFDRGHVDYKKSIKKLAHEFNLKNRVKYIRDGDITHCLKHCLGVVLVNSTVGLSALHHNKPVIALSKQAVYSMDGLTFQGPLHLFWNNTAQPNRLLYQKFKQYLLDTNQLKGSFYFKEIDFSIYFTCYKYEDNRSREKPVRIYNG